MFRPSHRRRIRLVTNPRRSMRCSLAALLRYKMPFIAAIAISCFATDGNVRVGADLRNLSSGNERSAGAPETQGRFQRANDLHLPTHLSFIDLIKQVIKQ